MDEKVYCKSCEYFDGWLSCNVPVSNNNPFGLHESWYSPNKNDQIIRYCCDVQNKNNDCEHHTKK